jgi:hypothetical protein
VPRPARIPQRRCGTSTNRLVSCLSCLLTVTAAARLWPYRLAQCPSHGPPRHLAYFRAEPEVRIHLPYRSISEVVRVIAALVERSWSWLSRSSKAEHRPLLVPGERQTRVRQQLVRS